jgi:hypothetical protein
MSKNKTRPISRSSKTGQFVTKEYAKNHKATTENEKIKIKK